MIDTKELRRLAQAASHPTTKGRWIRLFGDRTVYDRMEDGCRGIPVVSTDKHPPSPSEAACLDFIAAANPAAISELLDRLEAAESDCLEQARLNGMGSEREATLMAKLEAAEKERDALRAAVQHEAGCVEAAKAEIETLRAKVEPVLIELLDRLEAAEKERDALQAKIEAMEQQEPVAWMLNCQTLGGDTGWILSWTQSGAGLCDRLSGEENEKKLYALPGAKGETK